MIRYKMLQLVALSIVTLMAAAGSGVAAPVVMSLQPTDYASFGVTGQATDLLSEAYNHRNIFRGIVNSQVFTLDGGGYLYL